MGIQDVLRVRWRVTSLEPPRVWRHCGQCGAKRPFRSSGKFRCNAQKKRLDVWLIYHCDVCGRTWTYPLIERRPVGEIALPLFQALARNDVETALRFASDAARLRTYADRVEPCADIRVQKSILDGTATTPGRLVIVLALSCPCDLRLDRLLARELALSRNALRTLHQSRLLTVSPERRNSLRHAVRDGQCVTIDLRALSDDDGLASVILRGAA